MATARPFAYNPGSPLEGTDQVGNLAIGTDMNNPYAEDYGGLKWWNGPDEDLGYVIAKPIPSNTQPTPVPGASASVGFSRTIGFDDYAFTALANNILSPVSPYTNITAASKALTSAGYWNSYIVPVLALDARWGLSSVIGGLSGWQDVAGGKLFQLYNLPSYNPSEASGSVRFTASSSQYGQCNTSLSSMSTFTISVWQKWDGSNVGSLPCILTEIYTGGPINYFVGNLQGVVAQGGYFNGGFQISPQFSLTSNTWYQIIVTCDSSQVVKIYVNNSLISTTTTGGSAPSSSGQGIRLMRRWDDPDYWGGFLGKVDIYDKDLSNSQVSFLWNSTKSRFGY